MLLYHFPEATCACKVRLVLAEKQLPYDQKILQKEELAGPEYRKINPKGVVPTLSDEGELITESSVIMLYLDDKYPENTLTPDTVKRRLDMHRWMKFVDDDGLHALGAITYTTYLRPKLLTLTDSQKSAVLSAVSNPINRYRREMWINKGIEADDIPYSMTILADLLSRVDAAISRDKWLTGSTYSLADAAVTPFFHRLELLGLLDVMSTPDSQHLDWWQRIKARPSYGEVFLTQASTEYKEQLRTAVRPHLAQLMAYLDAG